MHLKRQSGPSELTDYSEQKAVAQTALKKMSFWFI